MKIFSSHKALTAYYFLFFSSTFSIANAAGWTRHQAPSPVWQITPKVENGVQNGLFIGCQDNRVYSLSANGDIEWSFDTKGLPAQLVSHDINGDNKAELIVATHDDAGTIYVLSDLGEVINSYAYGVPFSSIGISSSNGIRIYGATYNCQLFVFNKDLTVLKQDIWNKPNPSSWYQSLKVGDVTGDGIEEVVVLNMQGTINIFSNSGTLLKRERIGGSFKRGDLFLVDINGDSRKEIITISAGVVQQNYAIEYKDGALNTLFTFDKLGTSASMTIIDDFLPASGLDILSYDPYVFGTNVYVNALTANGTSIRNRKQIKKENMHLPLCVTLSADKETIIAGAVGTRDNAYYTIAGSAFQAENYPLLPEVNFSLPALQNLAAAIQSTPEQDMMGDKPYVMFIRGYVNQYNLGNMDGWAAVIREFEALAPHVKVVIEFPVDTKSQMTHQQLMDFTDRLEREKVPFTYEMSSGSSPSDISVDEMREVLQRAPTMCYGFATTENARYARDPNDPWKKNFFPMVLEVAELCKAHGKTINVQENSAGWALYAGDPDVITKWFAPELKGTIIPIVRNNSIAPYMAMNAVLGLEAAGFSEGWGVSIQDWMWVDQGKHLIAGMVPRELMTRSNMMAAAMGARYFQFEAGGTAMEDLERITSDPEAPAGLQEDGVFFQYLRKGMFPGYHSSLIRNYSTHAIGLEYNDRMWIYIQNAWFLGMWNNLEKSVVNSGVLGMHTALQPLPEKNVYTHLYEVENNRSDNFKTPYGLIPIVPSPYEAREGAVDFQLIKTDRQVYLGEDTRYENKTTLLDTFEKGTAHHLFRTRDAFLSVYAHNDGYLLYVVGSKYFEVDNGPVTLHVNDTLEVNKVTDFVTGEEVVFNGNQIDTNIPGGVMRILYVEADIKAGLGNQEISQPGDVPLIKLKQSVAPGHIGLEFSGPKPAFMDLITLDGKVMDRFMLKPGVNELYTSVRISGMALLRVRAGQRVQTYKILLSR